MPPRPPTPPLPTIWWNAALPATRPCLAAGQIGETKRIVAYLNEGAGRPQVMYNPRVTQKLKPYTLWRPASRARADGRHALRLGARELRGAGRWRACGAQRRRSGGNAAQAVQHMIDHCEGVLWQQSASAPSVGATLVAPSGDLDRAGKGFRGSRLRRRTGAPE